MAIFLMSFLLLVAGYCLYGVFVEKVLGIDFTQKTPAETCSDGIDFVPLKPTKIFLIQFLNIAGLGPVFGALLGALYGPICLVWIVFGCIFAGAVHDFISGTMSLHNHGCTITAFAYQYFGKRFYAIFMLILMLLMILAGSIFAQTPAHILGNMTGWGFGIWLIIVFGYYFLATLLPIDKIIGRFYPFFGACLIFSTFLLFISLLQHNQELYPDLTTLNQHPKNTPIFPVMFITIACGALSGFHATQSPMMARCITNEKYARPIFYGSMIMEGLIALIWATLGIAYYQGVGGLNQALSLPAGAGGVVSEISNAFLGKWGGQLAVLSVVFLAITTGDTALRSARLSMAEYYKIDQKRIFKRLLLTIFVLIFAIIGAFININTIWCYFGWVNQLLAMIVLWMGCLYLRKHQRNYWIALLPALFITMVCMTNLGCDKILLNLPMEYSYLVGFTITLIFLILFLKKRKTV